MSKKLNLMIKNKLDMKNVVKIISVAFSVMALSLFVSCDMEETKKTESNSSVELNDISITSVQKRPEGEVVYKSVSYNENNKEEVLSELIEGFIEYLYVDLGFDSQKEVLIFDVEKHIKEQQYVLKYDFRDIGGMIFALAMTGTDFEILEPNKEQLELYCNGGTNDGKSIIVDKPKGIFSGSSKKMLDFANECLDGGGCVEICTASIAIASIVLKTSDPRITE